MKTRPENRKPDRLRVNFVFERLLLAEKVKVYYGHSRHYAFECSETPLPEHEFDCYIVPFESLKTFFRNRARPDTWLPVIAYGPPGRLTDAFGLGCRDFLKEPWDLAELDVRLTRLLRPARGSDLPNREGEIKVGANRVWTPAGEAVLKPNEARILKALLKAGGEVVTREVLYYAIWGKVKNPSSRVVDVHVCALRKKLKGLMALKIEQVRGEGYILS
ncbi:MAG: response regulator transcription factor [Spirochaetales bacterium]|nr:response regulator transcription factor [Spirochaetales bacterium]